MTFEEFFNKKRIDLAALQAGEPGLFSEFKKHFYEMGEKSFDHTKKYWFNNLRKIYHLAPELKPEKVHIENQLAEQTIAESILEEKMPAPSVGFKPRFKAGMASKSAETAIPTEAPTKPVAEVPTTEAAPKPAGFKPRFNMKMATPKADETSQPEEKTEEAPSAPEVTPATETTAPKPAGFKPRFNMKMIAPKADDAVGVEREEVVANPEQPAEPAAESTPPTENTTPKPAGFKPRFNAKTMKPKPPEDNN